MKKNSFEITEGHLPKEFIEILQNHQHKFLEYTRSIMDEIESKGFSFGEFITLLNFNHLSYITQIIAMATTLSEYEIQILGQNLKDNFVNQLKSKYEQ